MNGKTININNMSIKTEMLRMEGIPYKSILLQQIPILEYEIHELARNIGRLNKELKPKYKEEKLLEDLMSDMDFKTRQLLQYR
jgi:hypothetical protein